jgi:hypothetical protein
VPGSAIGFVTTRVVAAASFRAAERVAIAAALHEWHSNHWPEVPHVEIAAAEMLSRRIWFYPPEGFTLYDTPEQE